MPNHGAQTQSLLPPTWTDLPPRVAPLLLQSKLLLKLVEGEAQLGEAAPPPSLQVEEEGPGAPEVLPAGLANMLDATLPNPQTIDLYY